MKANEMLFWLSARRKGTWQQFRAAAEELHSAENDSDTDESFETGDDGFPLHQKLRLAFEQLAHVEFFTRDCPEGWCVAPPVLAAHPVQGGVRAVLCGARSPALCERLFRAAEGLGRETLDHERAPQVIRLVAVDSQAIEQVARRVGVHAERDAPLAIVSQLPPCASPSRSRPQSQYPLGADWNIAEFDAPGLCWKKTDRGRAQTARTGVFRFVLFQRWRYFLRWEGGTYELPQAIAIYAILRRMRCRVLRYSVSDHTLSLPAACRPPRLLERALVLCSGLPPCFDRADSRLTYVDVPPQIARYASELLRQRLS